MLAHHNSSALISLCGALTLILPGYNTHALKTSGATISLILDLHANFTMCQNSASI